MHCLIRRVTLVAVFVTIGSAFFAGNRAHAQSYQIDCAILLCLAGGWPASEPCARARAEFIRRITPWPVEPPLQIWRCPMGTSFKGNGSETPFVRTFDILLNQARPPLFREQSAYPSALTRWGEAAVLRTPVGRQNYLFDAPVLRFVQDHADIDVSGPEFNFVRSIVSGAPAPHLRHSA